MKEASTQFEQWALVEIYGHQKYAGLVTEQTIGGCNFVRVDVPATDRTADFTKLFGQGAIFSITPIQEDVARALACHFDMRPVKPYELPPEFRAPSKVIEQAEDAEEDDFEDEDQNF